MFILQVNHTDFYLLTEKTVEVSLYRPLKEESTYKEGFKNGKEGQDGIYNQLTGDVRPRSVSSVTTFQFRDGNSGRDGKSLRTGNERYNI